jgi:H+/Cl- antiporter ClcA
MEFAATARGADDSYRKVGVFFYGEKRGRPEGLLRRSLLHRIEEHLALARYALKWLPYSLAVALPVGTACALFLWALERATFLRFEHPALLYALPLAGAAIGAAYHHWGRSVEGGNNLILDSIHEPGAGVPARLTPLILATTVLTHLFGGSAGREGTAVQMGGGVASLVGRVLGLEPKDARVIVTAGVAAGFGAVFGTPLAGAVFAMEVLAVGGIRYEALLPCLASALLADWTCRAWGIHHVAYAVAALSEADRGWGGLGVGLCAKAAAAGAIFGAASLLFSELTHGLGAAFKRVVRSPVLRPALGGALVIGLTFAVGSRDYLGLGVASPDASATTIVSCFRVGGATAWAWWWKTAFTALTLGAGFKGGEVTPLFYIGAALGNVLSRVFSAPTDLFAALGFAAVFSGAANTPLACTIMGIELFGAGNAPFLAVACFVAYLFSGHSGIYLSQRISLLKNGAAPETGRGSLRQARTPRTPRGNAAS